MLDATIEMVDGVMVVSPKKVKFEPKDGDVVYVKTSHENIIIYKEQPNKLGRYVNYIDESTLCTHMGDYCGSYFDIIEIRPATEEEKKKLFDKLAEEGYEWKPDTKELIKLKWKPKVGDEYYHPSCSITNDGIRFDLAFATNTAVSFDMKILKHNLCVQDQRRVPRVLQPIK